MSIVIDTKTKQPWSALWRNRKFAQIHKEASDALVRRDRQRGIGADGQVYTTQLKSKGEHSSEVATVDRALAGRRHTGREVRLLYRRRIAEFCSEPQDLQSFVEEFGTPDAEKLKAAQEAAQGVVESLADPHASPADLVGTDADEDDPPDDNGDEDDETDL